MRARWAILAAPILSCAALSAALVYAGAGGWKGAPNRCVAEDACYCEAFRPGPIKQPANTWSCLAFVAVGLLCAGHAYRAPASGGRMGRSSLYPALFAAAIALIGPASMALHAGMTDWGGRVDGASMDLFIASALAFGLSRRFGWGDAGFLAAAAAATAAPVAGGFVDGFPRGELTFGLLVAAFGANELLPEGPSRSGDLRWLKVAAACFAAAFAVWLACVKTNGPLCVPDSLWQGHALWHVLTALAAGAVYLHLRQSDA